MWLVVMSLLLLIGFSACKKYLELPLSPVLIESQNIFSDDRSATSAVVGLYIRAASTLNTTYGALSVYTGLYADDLYNTAPSESHDPFYQSSLLPSTGVVSINFWRPSYTELYQTNSLIEGLEKASVLTPAVKQQLLGESYFMRAWHHWHLFQLFGEIPLMTSTDYQTNQVKPRTPAAEILQSIINDLEKAKNNLSVSYITAGKLRPNKWAATAFLARVYLYNQNWQKAGENASQVINSNMYQLTPDPANAFLPANTEAIWQLIRDNNNTSEAAIFIPASTTAKPLLACTDTLIRLFETGDKRKTAWLRFNTVGGQPYYYPFKYRVRTTTPVSEYKQPLRLAEQYFIRAEASIQLNMQDAARSDINIIRTRAGLTPITTNNTQELMNALEKERRAEFFAEDGHRWFDLKRWGRAAAVLGPLKPQWSINDLLFPIPQLELDRNPFLTQNPGY